MDKEDRERENELRERRERVTIERKRDGIRVSYGC